jgi:hypothetical protein
VWGVPRTPPPLTPFHPRCWSWRSYGDPSMPRFVPPQLPLFETQGGLKGGGCADTLCTYVCAVQVTLEARQMLIVQQGMSVQQKLASIESLLRAIATGSKRDSLQHSSVSSPSDTASGPSAFLCASDAMPPASHEPFLLLRACPQRLPRRWTLSVGSPGRDLVLCPPWTLGVQWTRTLRTTSRALCRCCWMMRRRWCVSTQATVNEVCAPRTTAAPTRVTLSCSAVPYDPVGLLDMIRSCMRNVMPDRPLWSSCHVRGQVDVMLPFFGHHDQEVARTAVRVYVMRLYRAYDIVSLDVTGCTNEGALGSSRAHSPESDIGLPTQVGARVARTR